MNEYKYITLIDKAERKTEAAERRLCQFTFPSSVKHWPHYCRECQTKRKK